MPNPADIERILRGLSQRQCQVLYWIFQNLEYEDIGQKLGFAEKTIQGDMSKVYRLFGMTGNTIPEKRRFLDREVRAVYETLIRNPNNDCASKPTTPDTLAPDPAIVAEVAHDAREGLIPLRALVVIQQPEPFRPPPPPIPRNLMNSAPREVIDMTRNKEGTRPIAWVLVGILGTLLCVAIGFIAYLLWQSPLRQPTEVALATPRVIRQTVVVTSAPVAVPQTVVALQTVVITRVETTIAAQPTSEPPTRVPSATATFVPTPKNSVALPFADNFDNGLSKVWIQAGGDWNMSNGKLLNAGNRGGIIWLGPADWTDFVVEADIGHGGCDEPQVLLRMQDPQNYVAAQVHRDCSDGGGLYLVKNGKQQKELAFLDTTGQHYKIEVVGPIYKLYVDGQLRASASDENFIAGSVGFLGDRQSPFDNFSIRPYAP